LIIVKIKNDFFKDCSNLKYSLMESDGSIINSLALIKLVYDDGSGTQTRFCLGIFFDRERILASSKCLKMSANESIQNVYGGFVSLGFNVTSMTMSKFPSLVEYEIESSDKNVRELFLFTYLFS